MSVKSFPFHNSQSLRYNGKIKIILIGKERDYESLIKGD